MNQMVPNKTIGTMRPCTNNIQLLVKPWAGYPRKVTLLIKVDKRDNPKAQDGKFPLERK
jgi:hypothetical protein